jgi:hypothetical protein
VSVERAGLTGVQALPFLALIHPSAWNRSSRKFVCRIVHSHGPMRPETRYSGVWLRAGPNTL